MVDFFYELRHDYCAGRLHPSPRRIGFSWTTMKLAKEEGEDSVVVKHQEGYAIEIYGNITVVD